MPELLPGKKAPLSVDAAFSQEVQKLDAIGPDPALEEIDDGDDELVDDSQQQQQPGPTPKTQPQAAAPRPGDQPAQSNDQPANIAPAASGDPLAKQPAAQPAAAAADDPWAEIEEIEYDDPDDGSKYVVRAPKKYADKVKNGYQRRSYTDKKLSSWGRNRQWIDPLIENGSFDRLSPYLQRIFADNELQQGLAELLNRRQANRPLFDPAPATPPQQQQQAPATEPQAAFDEKAEFENLRRQGYDDYTAQATVDGMKRLASLYAPQQQQLGDLRRRLDGYEQQQNQQATQQQQRQQQEQHMRNVGTQAANQLIAWYPNELNANTPPDVWKRIEDYARNSGLINDYGFTVGAFTTAYMRMRETGLGINDPTVTRAPSDAVAAVAEAAERARQIAAASAGNVAAAHAPSNGAGQAPANGLRKVDTQAPRFRKDTRTGRDIPLTATETAKWIEQHTKRQPASA